MQKYSINGVMETSQKAILLEAKHKKKAEKVILKEVKKPHYTIEDCNNNREVQLMGKMQHENIHKMIEMFLDNRELVMVFEHYPEDLRRVMKKRDKPFTEPETKSIMTQLLSGIAFIHEQEYIHCGLKPAVIVCNEDASVVKITDFSTAKCLSNAPFAELHVDPTWYTAPEVLLGSERYSKPIDVWSAGCIMAELLTGKPILQGNTNQTQMLKINDFLGTLTRCQWPEGISLITAQNYKLPKNIDPQGFSNLNFEGSSDAKEMILDMLKWCPEKRSTAEKCLNSSYLGSSGSFGGTNSVAAWKERWRHNIPPTPLHELDLIIRGMPTSRQAQDAEQTDWLAGNKSPLDGHAFERAMSGANNGIGEQRGGLRNFDETLNSLEEEALVRQERRQEKPNIANNDMMFDEAFITKDKIGRNDKGNTQLELDNQLTARGQGLTRPERLKQRKPHQYASIYTNHLSYVLGGNGEDGNPKKDIFGNDEGDFGCQTMNTGRYGKPNFANTQSTNFDQKQDSLDDNKLRFRDPLLDTNQQTQPLTDRALSEKIFKDHEKEAKRVYEKSKAKYHDRYGNTLMRDALGGKPPGSMRLPEENMMDNKTPRTRRNEPGYTPTWGHRGQSRTGN